MASDIAHLADSVQLLLTRGGTTESASATGPVEDAQLVAAVHGMLRQEWIGAQPQAAADDDEVALLTARDTVRRMHGALTQIAGGTPPGNLPDDHVSALEVIVHSVGRPAMRYDKGYVRTPTNQVADNEQWHLLVAQTRDRINKLSGAVGRIARGDSPAVPVEGTGWRVGRDLLVTNHHVLDALTGDPSANAPLDPARQGFVDFAFTDGAGPARRFAIADIVGRKRAYDIAVLRLGPGDGALPEPIAIEWSKEALGGHKGVSQIFRGAEVYAVGHPWSATAMAGVEGVFGGVRLDGRKRWAPGLVTGVQDSPPVFRHDCSTLAGNSGSCIAVSNTPGDHLVVGLHFGGREDGATKGFGSTNFAIAFALIADDPVARLLEPQAMGAGHV